MSQSGNTSWQSTTPPSVFEHPYFAEKSSFSAEDSKCHVSINGFSEKVVACPVTRSHNQLGRQYFHDWIGPITHPLQS
jgi:hypothetical protein